MEAKSLEGAPPNAPSYEEAMKCSMIPPSEMHPYPSAMLQQQQQQQQQSQQVQQVQQAQPMVQPMVQPTVIYQPAAQPAAQPMIQNFNIGGTLGSTCNSCQKPLHTRVGYVSTCSTHCGFLLCCLIFCWPCAPFVYCTKSCREPRLYCVNCGKRV